jgi:uncharacterized protein YggE
MFRSPHLWSSARVSLGLALFAALLAAATFAGGRGPAGGSRPGAAVDLSGLGATAAFAQGVTPSAGSTTGIVASGSGQASGAPDVAFVNVGVQSQGQTAREALDQNAATTAAVIDALKRAGIPDKNIRTAGISVSEIRAQPQPNSQTPPPIIGYRAQNTLNVTVEPVTKAGEAIDVAVTAGANVVGGIQFGINDDSALRRQALDQAAKAARADAEALAGALGVRLGALQSVAEEGTGPVPLPRVELAQADARGGAAPPIQPGELTLRVSVRVVYGIG